MMSDVQDKNISEDLVSIIMPTYNCGGFIGVTLDSVITQTYQNWELIVVDDCSIDNTEEVVKSYMLKEPRIQYYKLDENSGAAIARNKAVELAAGKYVAFLDSDDLWFPEKLSKQISFMKRNNYTFSCTSYTKIDESGNYLNRIIKANVKSDYDGILKRNPGNSTVIYNAMVLGKFKIPNIKKRNDYVMWLQVIKKAKYLYGIEEPLGSHRIRTGSLSRKKANLVSYHWKVYREIEELSIFKSSYLIIYWVIVTVFKLR
jgi:teichuronic acid biosynthesis glycosyltransferase TuaG